MRKRDAGFTLIELLVVMLVGSLLSAVVWGLFSASSRHSRGIDERLGAVQAAHMLIEHLRHDLAQAIVTDEIELTVSTGDDGATELSFVAADAARPASKGRPSPDGIEVVYRFDPVSHEVTRNGEAIAAAAFAQVEFRYVAPNASDEHAAASLRPSCLQYRVTAASPSVLERIDGGLRDPADRRGRVTLVGSVRIESQTYRGQFPDWVEHDFETPLAQ